MNNIFVCETPFHIISSYILIKEKLKNENNDIILVDSIKNADSIADNLNRIYTINKVIVVRKFDKTSSIKQGLINVGNIVGPFSHKYDISNLMSSYDCIYCRNYTAPFVEELHRYYKNTNPFIEIRIFDEGYSSYTKDFWSSHNQISLKHKALNFILNSNADTFHSISTAYFFEPDLLKVKLPFKIERMCSKGFDLIDYKDEVNQIFGFDSTYITAISNKIIFFEECFAFDQGNAADIGILDQISSIVGKRNIIIKRHPRSPEDRFSRLGYQVMRNDSFPWEVYMLNLDEPLILLAYSSGALVNFRFFMKKNIHSILLFNLFYEEYDHIKDTYVKEWFTSFAKMNNNQVCIPSTTDELKKIVKKINRMVGICLE